MKKAENPSFFRAFTVPWPYVTAVLAWGILLAVFPEIDLTVSRVFYDEPSGRFPLAEAQWVQTISFIANGLSFSFLLACGVIYLANRVSGRNDFHMRGRLLSYFLLAFMIGPLLTVHFGLKEYWGRARPVNVQEFGGQQEFTAYYQPSLQCDEDCSFSSGHTVRGFYFITLYFAALAVGMAAKKRRMLLAGVLTYGVLSAAMRLLEGKHYLSDVTASAVIMAYVAWVLYRIILLPRAG